MRHSPCQIAGRRPSTAIINKRLVHVIVIVFLFCFVYRFKTILLLKGETIDEPVSNVDQVGPPPNNIILEKACRYDVAPRDSKCTRSATGAIAVLFLVGMIYSNASSNNFAMLVYSQLCVSYNPSQSEQY